MENGENHDMKDLQIPISPESFFRSLFLELSCIISDIYGKETTSDIIQTATQTMTPGLIQWYKDALETAQFSNQQVVEIVQDVMNRINGDFYLEEKAIPATVLVNRRCPFGEEVKQNPALCMMTHEIHRSFFEELNQEFSIDLKQSIARNDLNCVIEIKKNFE